MNALGRGLIVTAVAAATVALGVVVFRQTSTTGTQISAAIDQFANPPDTAAGSAFWGRYKARREVLDAMRAWLQRLVALDSALARDSLYPTSFALALDTLAAVPSRVSFMNYRPYVTPNGWYASAEYSPITCAVAVGPDTTIRGAPSGTIVCYSVEVPVDSSGFEGVMSFGVAHPRDEYTASLGDSLVVRVTRQMHANGTHMGWHVAVEKRVDGARSRSLLYRTRAFHGPHPSDLLAWIEQVQYYPGERVLPVYGQPYDLRIVCRNCAVAGDSAREHFTSGSVRLDARKLAAPHPPPVDQ